VTGTFAAVPGAHRGGHPAYRSALLLDDLLLRDVVLEGIRDSRQFDDGTREKVESAYDQFLDQFETSDGASIKPGTEAKADPVTDEELEQERIVKQKRG
jgi:hypothetical protein